MRQIIIAEDEIAINRMLCLKLQLTGYQVIPMYDGQQVLDFLRNNGTADLAIVDIMMPKVDGFALLQPLQDHKIPIIFLTARGDLESKIKGLAGGAEDYMTKPFEMLELIVRIEKILKRYGKEDTVLQLDDLCLDTRQRTLTKSGELIALTPIEFDLLLFLAQNRNTALSREKMLGKIWGMDFVGETRTVDVHIAQLRKKTGLKIVTVPKIGYRLEVKAR